MPPVNTEAFGVAEFIFSDDLTKLHYRVILKNIEKVTSCQIHLGKSTQIDPVVLYLYELLEQGISLNEGSITGVVNVEDFEDFTREIICTFTSRNYSSKCIC